MYPSVRVLCHAIKRILQSCKILLGPFPNQIQLNLAPVHICQNWGYLSKVHKKASLCPPRYLPGFLRREFASGRWPRRWLPSRASNVRQQVFPGLRISGWLWTPPIICPVERTGTPSLWSGHEWEVGKTNHLTHTLATAFLLPWCLFLLLTLSPICHYSYQPPKGGGFSFVLPQF